MANRRGTRFDLRLLPEDKRGLQNLAKQHGFKYPSDFIREVIRTGKVPELKKEPVQA